MLWSVTAISTARSVGARIFSILNADVGRFWTVRIVANIVGVALFQVPWYLYTHSDAVYAFNPWRHRSKAGDLDEIQI